MNTLQISEDHQLRLKNAQREVADEHLADYATARFPDELSARPRTEVVDFIREVRSRATQHDVIYERDIATATDLSLMYGTNFYEHDWAKEIFLTTQSGHEKMEKIRLLLWQNGISIY